MGLQGEQGAMTLTQQVYERLRQDIYMLHWDEQEFLTESALARTYQVSKAPIREALYRLCREGMMESYPRRGYRIRVISKEEYEQVKRIRYANETLALEFYLAHPRQELLDEMIRAAERSEDVGGNLAFHMALARASQNQILIDLIDRLMHCVSRSITMMNQAGTEKPPVYHREIVRALTEGDKEKAMMYLKQDIGLE